MKVLLVNKFHYLKGGSETYYFALGRLLNEKGIDVIYFSMKDDKNMPCAQESYFVSHVDYNNSMSLVQTVTASAKLLYSLEAKQRFEKLLIDEKPDIIHLNIFQSQLSGSIVEAAYKRHIPIVYTAHDLKSVCPNYLMMHHQRTCEECLDRHYWHCFTNNCMKASRAKSLLASLEAYVYKMRKIYQKIDYVITPSFFYKNKLETAGIFQCPIEHVKNFLPPDTVYAAGTRGNYFLYFGRLSREKGICTLIKAFSKAQIQEKLYIVGSGPEEDRLRLMGKELGMEEKILFLGFKTGSELKSIVANALCVCLTSEWYENGPYSILEAQALGKPVIVSDFGGLPELVEDGRTGYITEAGNIPDLTKKIRKMSQFRLDSAYISSKAANAYSADQYAEHVIDIYKILISRGSKH